METNINPMTEEELCSIVSDLYEDCKTHHESLSDSYDKATEYYNGIMRDIPASPGRSKVVSRDMRVAIKKALPSICRVLIGGEKIVEYAPKSEEDEDAASQATDYVNDVIIKESRVTESIYDAVHNAFLYGNGVLKWWHDKRHSVHFSQATGLSDEGLNYLQLDDAIEIIEVKTTLETVDDLPTKVHDIKLKRLDIEDRFYVKAIPFDELLIHPSTIDLSEAPALIHHRRLSRSDLVEMGLDPERVEEFSKAQLDKLDQGNSAIRGCLDLPEQLEKVDYYECYARIDYDGDGIAELRRIIFVSGFSPNNMINNQEADEIPFSDVCIERNPHQRQGWSLFDDIADIQRIKTVLLRQTLDNLYWQNNPIPRVTLGHLENPDEVMNPEFGKPVRIKMGSDPNAALSFMTIPFVAKESFSMINYFDQAIEDRTGINDASSGLPADALQNVTAKASALIEQTGIAQVEMIVRTLKVGIETMFRGLLGLIVQHQDKKRTVRLRNKWVEFDPRSWNASMDAQVNTGLGAGTRERDMMAMGLVLSTQEKLVSALGHDNPFIKPDNIYNAIAKQLEAAGLKSINQYISKPDPQEIAAKLEAAKNQPNPEALKLQAQMQLEQFKAQAAVQKENAQMEADVAVRHAELERDTLIEKTKLNNLITIQESKNQIEREKMALQMEMKKMELGMKADTDALSIMADIHAQNDVIV